MQTKTDFVPRALAAWFRARRTGHPRAVSLTLPDGRHYVAMVHHDQVLGVFRVRPCGTLRWLKRWPQAIEVAAQRQESM
jgi:hypothetical protein